MAMVNQRLRALLALVAAAAILAIGASGAGALSELHYAGVVLAPNRSFQAPYGFAYPITGNIAAYLGSGSVSVCQDTYDASYTPPVTHTGCAINAVGNALNLMPYYGHYLWPYVRNNSGSNHTIHGWEYWG